MPQSLTRLCKGGSSSEVQSGRWRCLVVAFYGPQRRSFDLALSRMKLTSVSRPIRSAPSSLMRSSVPVIAMPSSDRSISPSCRPADAAGPPGSTPADAHCPRACTKHQCHAPGQRHSLRRDSDMCAAHASVADDLTDDIYSGVACDRKADALRPADHRGVDADHLSCCRDERPTGVAGVKRGVSTVRFERVTIARAQRRPRL
jgi:hypothetical protein